MIGINREIINAAIITCIYIVIFIAAEFIHRLIPSRPEISRKFTHFFGGMTALSFPYLLKSHVTALTLALGFILLLVLAKRREGLASVFGITRKTYGTLCFPIAIYLVFLLGSNRPVLYSISILVLTISDVVAALIGQKYGSIKFEMEGHIKTLEGSISFFFITFLCIHIPLLLLTNINRPQSILIALVISILVTAFELISFAGIDNIFIPVGTYYILAKMTQYPLTESVRLMTLLLIMIVITLLIFWTVKAVKWSGITGMILLNFAAWSLLGFTWFLPILLSEIIFFFATALFKRMAGEEIPSYHIKAVFYTAIIPAILIFITNALNNKSVMYLPFIVANATQTSLICSFLLPRIKKGNEPLTSKNCLIIIFTSTIASIVIIALPPVLLYLRNLQILSILIIGASVFVGFYSNAFINKIFIKKQTDSFDNIGRFRIRVMSTALSVFFALIAQLPIIADLKKAWFL